MSVPAMHRPKARAGRLTPGLLVGLALCATLAGRAAGNDAQTLREVPDTVPAQGSVPLRATLTDDSERPDRLLEASTPAAASVELLDADGSGGIDLPPEGAPGGGGGHRHRAGTAPV